MSAGRSWHDVLVPLEKGAESSLITSTGKSCKTTLKAERTLSSDSLGRLRSRSEFRLLAPGSRVIGCFRDSGGDEQLLSAGHTNDRACLSTVGRSSLQGKQGRR